MKLIFIRHGDPDYSIDSLTPKGWKEASLLSDRVSKWTNITQFYCSPLGRAKDTAKESLQKLGREAITYDWLKEFFVPVIDPETGKERIPWDFYPTFWKEQDYFYNKDTWMKKGIFQTGNIEEAYDTVCDGIDGILREYGYNREGDLYLTNNKEDDTTLVFFCHLGVSFVIIGHLLGIAPSLLWHSFFVAPTSVTILGCEERQEGIGSFRIQTLGDTSHLIPGDEPISSSGYFTDCFQK